MDKNSSINQRVDKKPQKPEPPSNDCESGSCSKPPIGICQAPLEVEVQVPVNVALKVPVKIPLKVPVDVQTILLQCQSPCTKPCPLPGVVPGKDEQESKKMQK